MARTILIVEDTDLCRDIIELALMGLDDIDVRAVGSAEEALRKLDDNSICAIVTDLRLASRLDSMDGFEFIAAVRAHHLHASLPIVVISGDSHPALAQRLSGLGVDAYFGKPYSPAAVRSKLEQLIFLSGARSPGASASESDRGPQSASHNQSSVVSPPSSEHKVS